MTAAHAAVSAALKNGRLTKGACEQASAECRGRVIAHHDDYARPLDVRWLCERHHGLHHSQHGPGRNRAQIAIKFYVSQDKAERLRQLAEKERRTQTVLLEEAVDLLFAAYENENHSVKT